MRSAVKYEDSPSIASAHTNPSRSFDEVQTFEAPERVAAPPLVCEDDSALIAPELATNDAGSRWYLKTLNLAIVSAWPASRDSVAGPID
jgi:hypothetical protein